MWNKLNEMFEWKIGDRYIHYTQRGELRMGIVDRLVQIQEYETRLNCKFITLILVNDKGQQIKTDGSEGFVYKISGCDELG